MDSYKKWYVFTVLLHLCFSSLHSQDRSAQMFSAVPTPNNFAYPQSIFIDSPSGHIWVTDFDQNRVLRFDVSLLTAVENTQRFGVPHEYFLSQNYPNPFNPSTNILFSVKTSSSVSLTVYNILGQEVASLFNEPATANTVYSIPFEGKNLPSGIYVYSLKSGEYNIVKRMCLLK